MPTNADGIQFSSCIEKVEHLQGVNPIYYDETGSYWIWDSINCVYKMKDDVAVMNAFYDVYNKRIYKSREKTETLELVRQTGRNLPITEPDKNTVVFDRTAVNIKTGEQIPSTFDVFYTSYIPHKIGDSEDTPIIDALFKSWVGDRSFTLYEIVAYCMLDDYPIHRLIALLGFGRNGKGQFTHFIERFIGLDNSVATDLDTLATNRNATAKLFKKKVATTGETDHRTILSTKRLKELTGGDRVDAELKFKDAFSYINTAKIIISTNALPGTTDRTDGYYGRWLIILFSNQFEEGPSVIDTIPEEEYENFARKCIRILHDLLERGKFAEEGAIEDRRKIYETYSNPVGTFVKTRCTVGENYDVPQWVLWEAYDKFQLEEKYRIITKPEFYKELRSITGLFASPHWYDEMQVRKYKNISSGLAATTWNRIAGIDLRKIDFLQTTF